MQGLTTLALSGGFTPDQVDQSLTEAIEFARRGYLPGAAPPT
jgi:hypothetical protein